ncbi:MAG: single-stranded-DNA-specific exonuclease RecJ [Gemmatimonadales bacterium]
MIGPARSRWLVADPPADAAVESITQQLNIPRVLSSILVMRGYTDPASAKSFLRPSFDNLHDPYRLPQMDVAVKLVSRAVSNGDTILVHGDYDVDGQCATTMLTRVLHMAGGNVEPFVPHRMRDGYDFGPAGLKAAREVGARLIVTCDCGATAVDTVRAAKEEGFAVVVTDHHIVGDLPPADAVLNPKRSDSEYPFPDLCGTGVAFKLVQALIPELGLPDNLPYHVLDLVALATIADIVPLTDENRILVRHGLKILASSRWPGLRSLVREAGVKGSSVTAGQVGYIIAPRLNAAGRVGDAMDGVRLLLTDDEVEGKVRAQQLEKLNTWRQELDKQALDEALEFIESDYDLDSEFGLVLAKDGWHAGVIGIVASRVVERFNRPTVLIALEGNVGKGSGRSISGFDLHAALARCAHLLTRFGGHKAAAGLSIERDRVPELREAFNEAVHAELSADDLIPTRKVDLIVTLSDATVELERLLAHLEPCGMGNPRPVLAVRGAVARGRRDLNGGHVKFTMDDGSGSLEVIGFNWADRLVGVDLTQEQDVAFHLSTNEWNGRTHLQARLIDVSPGP